MRIFICLIASLIITSVFFSRCNIINPKEQVPTYVHVDSFHMASANSANITAVWAYYNNNPIGVFDLPATIPVIADGTGLLTLSPAIAVNGQNGSMAAYPFYKSDTFSFAAQPGKVINRPAVTDYFSTLKIVTIADFEGPIGFTKWAGNVGMTTTALGDPLVYAGNRSGAIYLNAVGDSSIDSSSMALTIPYGAAFIELNYNTTVPFYIGLQPVEGSLTINPVFLVGVNPNNKWNKFYVNLQGFLSSYPASSYYLYIKAVLGDGQTSGRVLLDNIKLVTF